MSDLVHRNDDHDDGLALAGINSTAHISVASANIGSNQVLSRNRIEDSGLLVAALGVRISLQLLNNCTYSITH